VDKTEHPDRVGAIPERARFCYADWEISLWFVTIRHRERIRVLWPLMPEVRAGAETAAEISAAFCCDVQPEPLRAGKREMTSRAHMAVMVLQRTNT
jgi:hypothetical protein